MAGTNLYWGRGEEALRRSRERARDPGVPERPRRAAACPRTIGSRSPAPARRRSRRPTSRSSSACRWTSGSASARRSATRPRSSRSTSPSPSASTRGAVAAELYGDLSTTLSALAGRRAGHGRLGRAPARRSRPRSGRPSCRQLAGPARAAAPDARLRRAGAAARPRRDRDRRRRRLRLVRGPRGRLVRPGCWLDPGPFGCLGSGPGYALAAKLAHPERQVVLLLGDGAFGFSGMEYDTLARHGVNVVGVMGNNGIWALEKHPMEFLYDGWSVAADLRPETRVRRGGRGARRARRAGARARRAARRAGAGVRERQAGARERADRPVGRVSARPRTSLLKREAARGGGGRLQSGPVRTGRGTCLEGPIEWSRRREAPMMRHRPDLCVVGRRREARPPFRRPGFSTLNDRKSNRTHVHERTIWTLTSRNPLWLRARVPTGCRAQRPRPGRGRNSARLLARSRSRPRSPGRGRDRARASGGARRAGPRPGGPAVPPGARR